MYTQVTLTLKKNCDHPSGIYLKFVFFKLEDLFVFDMNQPIRLKLLIAIPRLHPDQISQCHENEIQPTDLNLTECG